MAFTAFERVTPEYKSDEFGSHDQHKFKLKIKILFDFETS